MLVRYGGTSIALCLAASALAACGEPFQAASGATGAGGGTGATTSTTGTGTSTTGGGGSGGGECTPSAEVCDGADNDCDDAVDEEIAPISCGLGECQVTVAGCSGGQVPDCVPTAPSPTEHCNGVDDNCNGTTDEGCSCDDGDSQPCYGGPAGTEGVGPCKGGTQSCVAGQWGDCVGQVLPSAEVCDNEDNDCDGAEDDGNPGGGNACATGLPGVCAAGAQQCINGAVICVQLTQPSNEICNNLDDDCDNAVDDNPAGVGQGCATGLPGACAIGASICKGGALGCEQTVAPIDEICGNAIDDDCDGLTDQVVTYLAEDFSDANGGFILGAEWQIKSATASSGQTTGNPDPALDHTPTADNGVAGVVVGGNTTTAVHGYYYLTSATPSTTPGARVHLVFWRWLNSDYTPYMDNDIEVYDGSSWITVWTSGGQPAIADASWTRVSIDVSPWANPSMRVRWGVTVGQSGAFVASSWNLDDVALVNTDACLSPN